MTEHDLELQRLRQEYTALKKKYVAALKDLDYVLCQYEMCAICAYADSDCDPESGRCVPKWRGLE